VVYPLARVEIEVNGQTHEVEAAVSKSLPMSMLMGTDVPAMSTLVMSKLGQKEAALAVVTRAQRKAQEEEEASRWLKEEESGVRPRSLMHQEEEVSLPNFDEDLFVAGRERERVKFTRLEPKESSGARTQTETRS